MTFRLNTAVALAELPLNFVPLVSDSDFKTIKTDLVYNSAGLLVYWNFLDVAGNFTQTQITPASSGNYSIANQGNGIYGMVIPASGGASVNNNAAGMGWFSGLATGVLPFVSPRYIFSPAQVNNSLVVGSEQLHVNVQQMYNMSLDITAAGSVDSLGIMEKGLAQSVAADRIQIRAAASFADNFFKGATVYIVDAATGAKQRRLCTSSDGATDTLFISPNWDVTPTGSIYYQVFASAAATADTILTAPGLRTALGMSAADMDTQLSAISNAMVDGFATVTTVTDKLDTTLELDGAVYHFSANALELAPAGGGGGGGLDAAGVRAAIGLAAANLDAQLSTLAGYSDSLEGALGTVADNVANIQTRIPAALSGGRMDSSVGNVETDAITAGAVSSGAVNKMQAGLATGSALTTVGGVVDSIAAAIAALNDISAAAVKAEIVAALSADTYAEISAIPADTTTLANMLRLVFAMSKNELQQTATQQRLRNGAGTGNIGTAAISSDGTTLTRGKLS